MSVLDPILSDIKLLEEHLLCAMVLDPGCSDMMRADLVSGSAWATPYLGAFFDLLCDLTDRRLPTDSVELTIYLHRSHADAARIGDPFWGKPYSTPSSEAHWAANGLSYANHVMSHCTPLGFSRLYGEWKRKRLEARIRTLGARIQSLPETRGDLDTDGLLEEAEALSASIAGEVAPTATTTGAAAAQSARDRYAERKALRSRGERVGVVTGLSVLDDGDGGALTGDPGPTQLAAGETVAVDNFVHCGFTAHTTNGTSSAGTGGKALTASQTVAGTIPIGTVIGRVLSGTTGDVTILVG